MNNVIDLLYFESCQSSLRYKFIKNFKHPLLGDCQLVREKASNLNLLSKDKDIISQEEFDNAMTTLRLCKSLKTTISLLQLHSYTYKVINAKTPQYRFTLYYEYLDQDLEKDLSLHQKSNEDYKETVLLKVLQDLSLALLALSSIGLLENIDLRPVNIYFYRDLKDVMSVKLFHWLFCLSPYEQILRGLSYYKFYLSPEEIDGLVRKNEENPRKLANIEKILSFSLGLLILNMASANATYERIYRLDRVSFDEKTLDIKGKFMAMRYSEGLCSIVRKMLEKDPNNRPYFNEILYFSKYPKNPPRNNSFLPYEDSFSMLSFELSKPTNEFPMKSSQIKEFPPMKSSQINEFPIKSSQINEFPTLKSSQNNEFSNKSSKINEFPEKSNQITEIIMKSSQIDNADNSFERKKHLLSNEGENFESRLESLKNSFQTRMTLLQDRMSNEAIKKISESPNISKAHTARKSSKFRPIDNIEILETMKRLQPASQADYISDNEWTSEKLYKSPKKASEIPQFIQDLEKSILYSSKTNDLKKGLIQIIYPDNSIYKGQVKSPDSFRHGLGVYYFANGDIYLGDWLENHIHGKGVYYFIEGEYYDGKFQDFRRQGTGIYQYNTGNRYEGEWKNDQKCGFGVFYYNNCNESYEGSWLDDEKDGEGIHTFNNGDKFVGRWKKGKKSGKGKVLFQDKGVFEGEWLEDYANGYGVLRYENGDIYEGNYEGGIKTGGGIYCHKNDGGSKYAGQWLEDERTGNGVYYYNNGDKYTGLFLKGKRCGKGEYIYENGDIYTGDWMEDKKEGLGQFLFKKGGYYQGQWKDNMMDEDGFMMYCNGDNYEGKWLEGVKHGKGVYLWNEGLGFDGIWEKDKMICEKGCFINKEGMRF